MMINMTIIRKIITTTSLVILFNVAFSQTNNSSFSLIDKRIKTIHSTDIDTLERKLTAVYKTDTEKVRSIFRWITENIAYDEDPYEPEANTDATFDTLNADEPVYLDKPAYKIENNRITLSYEIKSEKAQKIHIVLNDKLILSYGIRFRQ